MEVSGAVAPPLPSRNTPPHPPRLWCTGRWCYIRSTDTFCPTGWPCSNLLESQMGLFSFKEKGGEMQLFLGHRLSAAHYSPIAATGYDEFSFAADTEIPFPCLIGHLDQPRTQRGLSRGIIRRYNVGSQPFPHPFHPSKPEGFQGGASGGLP